jgi:hypothetical protein
MYKRIAAACLGLIFCGIASANTVTGTIRTLYVHIGSGNAYVQMDGLQQFNGGACAVYWTANPISDEYFMKYVWSLLLTAKATGSTVSIEVNGCTGQFPKIVAAEFDPRLAN